LSAERIGATTANNRKVARTVRYISLLGLVLAVFGAALGYGAAQQFGPVAYRASAVAAAINWAAGAAALLSFGLAAGKPWRVQAALGAMAVRMAVPLAALVFFSQSKGPLAAHGVAGLTVVLYLVGLIVETALGLRLIAAGNSAQRQACRPAPSPLGPF
jgi:hypothetical protein